MKNILTIDREVFRKKVAQVSTSQLKSLLEGLFTYLKKNGENWMKNGNEIVIDLERKQSIIWKELQRRGVLNKNTNEDFMNWLYKKNDKKYY